jgi:hypothetical protein
MIAGYMDIVDASALTTADVPVVRWREGNIVALRKWARPEKSAAGFHLGTKFPAASGAG